MIVWPVEDKKQSAPPFADGEVSTLLFVNDEFTMLVKNPLCFEYTAPPPEPVALLPMNLQLIIF